MIALGVVGWDESASDPQDVDATTDVTLVRVTLVNDHDVLADLREGKAYGKEIVAQAMGTLGQDYVAGMRVVVAIPDGLEAAPGAAVILGVLAHPPTDFVALAQKVLDELNKIKNAFNGHVHGAGTFSNGGGAVAGASGPPSQNPSGTPPVTYSPASVAATESKAR